MRHSDRKIAEMNRAVSARDFTRRIKNQVMRGVLFLTALLAIVPLLSIFLYVVTHGFPAMNLEFFLSTPVPMGESGGGMANAMLGTAILIALAVVAGVPIGIAAGVYLSEYAGSKLATSLRFAADILASIPSIIIGLFVYAVMVKPMHHPSAYAGGAALAIIMIPTIARTTEELLKLVPVHIREAGLALGIPRWKVTLLVVLRGSLGGIMTGVMLAIARAAGETAPLILTAFGSIYWPRSLDQPIASLPVQIYTYAISPYEEWHRQAWAGALLLVLFVFMLNLSTRLLIKRQPMAKD